MIALIKSNRAGIFAALVALAILLFAFINCTGPRAELVSVQTQTQPAQVVQQGNTGQQQITTYKVTVTVENKSVGEGQVLVTVKMVDKQNGKTVAEDTNPVQLSSHEQEEVDFNFDLPTGDYETKTDVRYPPD